MARACRVLGPWFCALGPSAAWIAMARRGEGLGEGTAESWEHDSCQGAARSRHGALTIVLVAGCALSGRVAPPPRRREGRRALATPLSHKPETRGGRGLRRGMDRGRAAGTKDGPPEEA